MKINVIVFTMYLQSILFKMIGVIETRSVYLHDLYIKARAQYYSNQFSSVCRVCGNSAPFNDSNIELINFQFRIKIKYLK